MHGHFAVIFLTYGLDNTPIFQNILHSILSEDEAIDIVNKWIDYVIKQHNEELLNSDCSDLLAWHPEYCCFGNMGATDGYVFMENHNRRINIGKVIIVMAEAYKPGSNDQFDIF